MSPTVLTPRSPTTPAGNRTCAPKSTWTAQGPTRNEATTPGMPTAATASRIRRRVARTRSSSPRVAALVSAGNKTACTGAKRNKGIRANTNAEAKAAAVAASADSRAVTTMGARLATSSMSDVPPARKASPRAIFRTVGAWAWAPDALDPPCPSGSLGAPCAPPGPPGPAGPLGAPGRLGSCALPGTAGGTVADALLGAASGLTDASATATLAATDDDSTGRRSQGSPASAPNADPAANATAYATTSATP